MSSSLIDGLVQLREAQELLERAWANSEDGWDDIVRQRFEETQLQPLRKQLAEAQQLVAHLGDVLNTARRQVSDADRSP